MGEIGTIRIIENLIVPPLGPLLLLAVGLVISRWYGRTGRALAIFGGICLYLGALPLTGQTLLSGLEQEPPFRLDEVGNDVKAIVILGGGRYPSAPEYGGDTVSAMSLERVRYGAWLQRRTSLPIVVSGGALFGSKRPESVLMRDTLREFGVTNVRVEGKSHNTAENARFTAKLLGGHGRVILVTHAWHMPRAKAQFEAQGLSVIAAPTGYSGRYGGPLLLELLPSAGGMVLTDRALHEWLGRLWYAIRY